MLTEEVKTIKQQPVEEQKDSSIIYRIHRTHTAFIVLGFPGMHKKF